MLDRMSYGKTSDPGGSPRKGRSHPLAILCGTAGFIAGLFLGTMINLGLLFAPLGALAGFIIGRMVENFIWKLRASKDSKQRKEKEPAESGPILKP